MPGQSTRRYIAEISRRLGALLEESVPPNKAVQLLVAQKFLPAQSNAANEQPLASAIESIIRPPRVLPTSAVSVAKYVRACESNGRGASALKLLGRLRIRRQQGMLSTPVIGVEFLLVLLVLLIHSIFVLPQLKAIFENAGTPLPAFTRLVLAIIGPWGSFLTVAALLVIVVSVWRYMPILLGPVLRPVDRLVMVLPLVGRAVRQSNSDKISGWLGFAASDLMAQRAAIEAARAWYVGTILSRECEHILHVAKSPENLIPCLARAPSFDSEFRAVLSEPNRDDALAALRARWRIAETLPERRSALVPVLAQIILGVIVAAVVIALYLPIFKLASVF